MQTVVITGANRGIGLQLARTFSRSGDEVIAAVRDPEHAGSLRGLPGGRGTRVLKLDVTDQASVDVFSRTLGGERIDILINNAGVMERRSELDAVDFAFWSRAMEVNAIGPLRVSAALLANLRQSERPRIITLTSRMGSMQVPGGGWFA